MTQPAAFKPEKFIRRPFTVEAVEVTPDNIYDVANWCNGQVRTGATKSGTQKYIKVEVKRALDEKQTKAYFGDWVLRAGSGFKVYTPKAFVTSFQKQVEEMLNVVERMVTREEAEEKAELDQINSETQDTLPTGGLNTSFISPG